MGTFELGGEEIIDREAKEFGGSAHVTAPKDWRGADVKVIRVTDRDENAAYNVLQRGLSELGLGHAEVTPAETALPTSATGGSSTVVDAKCVVETGSPVFKERTAQAVSE